MMLLNNHLGVAAILFMTANMSSSTNLRSVQKTRDPIASECTILVGNQLNIDVDGNGGDDDFFDCVLHPSDADGQANIAVRLQLDDVQVRHMKNLLEKGELVSEISTLKFGTDIKIGKDNIFIPPGLELMLDKIPEDRRRLAVVTGDKHILVVKVTDSVGKARSETMDHISDNIFGTFGDPVNLKSQMYDCSFSKLNITAGRPSVEDSSKVLNGITEVTIPVELEGNPRGTIRNAVTTAVQNHLEITLPGPYQQVMYVLEGCYQDCGWAAYAYINSWNSIYQGSYYMMTGVQMHEIGHNFNFAHSGGLDGATYTDHTGMMGNPLYSDDVGRMCWNAAKTWQVGWYDDRKETINPRNTPNVIKTILGVADYGNNPNGHPVVLRIETSTSTDQFIAFNRATGMNSQNDQADNQVTVVETGNNGEGYSQSYLKATLSEGVSYIIPNWAGTGDELTITVITINLSTSPGYATISIILGSSGGGDNDETLEPTPSPSTSPSVSHVPTNEPTISNSPSFIPSSLPTVTCIGLSKNECNQQPHCSYSNKIKACESKTFNPPSPSPPPPPPPAECPFCPPTNEQCCGTCIVSGQPSKRGCFF